MADEAPVERTRERDKRNGEPTSAAADGDVSGQTEGRDNAAETLSSEAPSPALSSWVDDARAKFLSRKADTKAAADDTTIENDRVLDGTNDDAAAGKAVDLEVAATRANASRARFLQQRTGGKGGDIGDEIVDVTRWKFDSHRVNRDPLRMAPDSEEVPRIAVVMGAYTVPKRRKFIGAVNEQSGLSSVTGVGVKSATREARDAFYLQRKGGKSDDNVFWTRSDHAAGGAIANNEGNERPQEGSGQEGASCVVLPDSSGETQPGAFQVAGIGVVLDGPTDDALHQSQHTELPPGGENGDRAPNHVSVLFSDLFESLHRRFSGRLASSRGDRGCPTRSMLVRRMARDAPLVVGVNVGQEDDTDTANCCVRKSRRWMWLAAPGFFLVGLVAGAVGLAVAFTRERTIPSLDAADSENRNMPTPLPTAAPTEAKVSVRFQNMARIVETVSDRDALIESSSAQHRTLVWLADDDELQLSELEDDEVILQRYIVALLYFALGGDGWTNKKEFLSGQHECDWRGIHCRDKDVISKIRLESNNVTGVLPKELFTFDLEALHLFNNNLFGPLPSQVENFITINVLNFGFNDLTGTIPTWINNYSTLRRLDMTKNKFSGRIPLNITALSALQRLSLYGNQLTGNISLFTAFNGTWLILGENNITGTLPPQLAGGASSKLEVLGLFSMGLTGTIPPSYFEMQHLVGMDMSDNHLTGTLPQSVRTFNLRGLALEANRLSGSIPPSLGKLPKLEGVNMHSNRLSGMLPSEMGNIASLKFLELGNNKLTGSVPESFRNLTGLVYLSLRSNKLEGSIDNLCNSSLRFVYADCGGGTNSSIQCSCCAFCCLDEGMEACNEYPSTVTLMRSCIEVSDGANEACKDAFN